MRTKIHELSKKDVGFIKEYRHLMSNSDLASFFKQDVSVMRNLLFEYGLTIDSDVSTAELEYERYLLRYERAHMWI